MRMRATYDDRLSELLVLLLLASCATSSPSADPCDLIDGGNYCPRAGNQRCKLERLRREFAACTRNEECEVLPFITNNCIGYGTCPRASVAVGQGEPFRNAAHASLKTHCAEVLCHEGGSCPVLFETALCEQGFCQTRISFEAPDGGSIDGGLHDAGVLDAGPIDECDLGPPGPYCPGGGRQRWRLERIRKSHAIGCVIATDCELWPGISNCLTYGSPCQPVSVRKAKLEAFHEEAAASLKTHCDASGCFEGETCIRLEWAAVCTDGVCQSKGSPPDGGP